MLLVVFDKLNIDSGLFDLSRKVEDSELGCAVVTRFATPIFSSLDCSVFMSWFIVLCGNSCDESAVPAICIGSTTSSFIVTTSGTASGLTSAIELVSGSTAAAGANCE